MRFVCAFLAVLVAAGAGDVVAADADATVAVSVRLTARTSLRVSTTTLVFVVPDGGTSATGAVDYTAGLRLQGGSSVVLNVDQPQSMSPATAGDAGMQITFAGDGDGTTSGTLSPSGSAVAAAWHGSGQHHGRIVFTLHASAPGVYRVPIELVLATP